MGLTTSPHVFQQDSTRTATKQLTSSDLNNTGTTKLLLTDVANDRGINLNFLASVPSPHDSSGILNDELNSLLDYGDIGIREDIFSNLGLQLVETGIVRIVSNDFDLEILDMDIFVINRAEEFMLLLPSGIYRVIEPDQFGSAAIASNTTFSSEVLGRAQDLNSLSNLSSSQEDRIFLQNTSSFDRDFDSNISVVGYKNPSLKRALQSEKH